MRFLIDECLHESLTALAHDAGFEATHVNHLGLSGQPDRKVAERIAENEFTFVTNNRVDFLRLFSAMPLHAGLIVLIPSVAPAVQRALFESVLNHLANREPVNKVIEVAAEGESVRCIEYDWPPGGS